MKEPELEKEFIRHLTNSNLGWVYRKDLKTEEALWQNIRGHIDRLNKDILEGVLLTDQEFKELQTLFMLETQTSFKASRWLKGENGVVTLTIDREDVSKGRVTLVLLRSKGSTCYEVVNQVVPSGTKFRGDVTLLFNGLPLVHIELKAEYAKDGYMQAFNQLQRYAEGGFFNGLYACVQALVISNKVSTRYFARPTTNDKKGFAHASKFLFKWRTEDNKACEDLFDFTGHVLNASFAHDLVSNYAVLVDDRKSQQYLMILKAYQIHAIARILAAVKKGVGGYCWHATGSGKTLTSFVATKILTQQMSGNGRTIMVLDRVDLDSQTKAEFAKFASESNTGTVSGKGKENTLIVDIDNTRQLEKALKDEGNNNTIIITTIQKLLSVMRTVRDKEKDTFANLENEHVTFIVDEAHRAVSDEQMRNVKSYLPKSTWVGLTGTPIFEENQKTENGTFARTTEQQYGDLLHAYTTKDALDDKSVLAFQVEYHSLLDDEMTDELLYNKLKGQNPKANIEKKMSEMTEYEKEGYLDNTLFEAPEYIGLLLKTIFKHQSVLEKFKVVNGMPTKSAILTTSSIAQAKRIYEALQIMKADGTLINGRVLDKRRQLRDPDFPRVAISYSQQNNMKTTSEDEAILRVNIKAYNEQFGTNYTYETIKEYEANMVSRLARKDERYTTGGNHLDLVIVVDRLLTGFDSPSVQTLYIDRDLRYQRLLQAFSRTNRTAPGKSKGMIVSFRKPYTMRENVRDAMRLFSNAGQDSEALVPREYAAVLKEFKDLYENYKEAKYGYEEAPGSLHKKVCYIRAYQALEKSHSALSSYDNYMDDHEGLMGILTDLKESQGVVENLKYEVKEELEDESNSGDGTSGLSSLLQDVEFSTSSNNVYKDLVDSQFIELLLRDIAFKKGDAQEERIKELLDVIKDKDGIVKDIYLQIISDIKSGKEVISLSSYFNAGIQRVITETSEFLGVDEDLLYSSLENYIEGESIPYLSKIALEAKMDRVTFDKFFEGVYRKRQTNFRDYWTGIIMNKLKPLEGEIFNE